MVRLILAAALLPLAGCSEAAPAQPAEIEGLTLTGRVVDGAHLLDAETTRYLEVTSEALEKATSDQLVVVTTPSLNGKTIEQVGLALGNGWGVGRKDLDNGVILLVAPTERKVRIEVGYGLEGLLTDERAGEIIKMMLPEFGEGRYAAGVKKAVGEIDRTLRSDIARPKYRPTEQKEAA